jgi:hypothetical protein
MVVVLLLFSCVVPEDSYSGGGSEGTPTGGGGSAGGSNGGSDGGDDGGGTDDTGTPVDCTSDDLEWTSVVYNNRGSEPSYPGDTFTFWGYVANPCAQTVPLDLESTCLFDIVTLHPPNGAATQQAVVPGCTTTSRTVDLGPSDVLPGSYTWGPLYVSGTYGYGLRTTTPDELLLTGSFLVQ